MTRQEAYVWLANTLQLAYWETHIGMFDVRLCQKVIYTCKKQHNPKIDSYRKRHGYRDTKLMLSRGYSNCTKH